MTIEDCRARIDRIDDELLRLLNERARFALKVGESKRRAGLSLCDEGREREVVERVCRSNEGPLDARAVALIFRRIIRESRRAQAQADVQSGAPAQRDSAVSTPSSATRVAFQGERGAFSEGAAVTLLGDGTRPVPRPTFESLFAAVGEGAADCALVPVENSLAGSVQRSYDLMLESPLHITGEVVIRVEPCLIGCPGSSLGSVKTVESHPVALAQCERFFAAHRGVRRVVSEDTAGSVAGVVRRGDPTRAAIAGRRAAETYGGLVLREHLEDDPENYTRFVLLAPAADVSGRADKLSLAVSLPDEPGSLHRALEPFARRRLDLLGIVTRPVRGHPWRYHFFLDLRASLEDGGACEALGELRERASGVRVLGCYPASPMPAARV
jgi:prephenate dehydratase/chorismate mutase